MRGKYAVRSQSQHEQELKSEVAHLRCELETERLMRTSESHAHAEEIAQVKRDVAGKTREMVEDYIGDNVDRLANGLTAAVWRSQRLAMTEHLAWLFFKGYLDWDRLNGDIEVLTYIATHGDISAWFEFTEIYGHRANRDGRRFAKRERIRGHGVAQLLKLDRDIRSAMSGNERLLAEREALNDVVDAARAAYIDVDLDEVMSENGEWIKIEPSTEQVAIHRDVCDHIAEYLELRKALS